MTTTSIASWLKDIKSLGPMGALTSICILLILVITGLVPTPLMSGLTTIPSIKAQMDEEVKTYEEILRVSRVSCTFMAKMASDDPNKCFK